MVSIPQLFLNHLLRCQRLFRYVAGNDDCQVLDVTLCPGLLRDSPLATCGSRSLTIPILCYGISFMRSAHSSELPGQNFIFQILFLTLNIFFHTSNFLVPGLVDNFACLHQQPSPRTNFICPRFCSTSSPH